MTGLQESAILIFLVRNNIKREISEGNPSMAGMLPKQDPPVRNGRVGTYVNLSCIRRVAWPGAK